MLIGIPYVMDFTDPALPGKTPFTVEPNTTDGPLNPRLSTPDSSATEYHTSVVFSGMGLIQYGERLQETILHILENFASATAPVVPTIGQEWYDYGDGSSPVMKVWNGTSWDSVGMRTFNVAGSSEFSSVVTDINYVIGDPSAPSTTPGNVHGYGQVPLTVPDVVTNADWITLIQTARKAGQHQGTDITSLVDVGFIITGPSDPSVMTLVQEYNALQTVITNLKANRANIDPSTVEVSIDTGGISSRPASWSSQITHEVDVQFTSVEHIYSFFNTGGKINVSAALTTGSPEHNTLWQALVNSLGTIKMSSFTTTASVATTNKGLYHLTNSYQTLVSATSGGVYYDISSLLYTLEAKIDLTTFKIHYRVTFHDTYSSPTVLGTMTSSIIPAKASALYVNNPEIAFPVLTTTVPLTA